VELALPWRTLGQCAHVPAPPRPGDQWRINFSRVEHALEPLGASYRSRPGVPVDNWVWSPHRILNMHYPELFGYVQFAGLAVGAGQEAFVDRPEEEAKRALYRVYYRQKACYREYGRFTTSLDELRLDDPGLRHFGWPPRIQVTDSLFEASVERLEVAGGADRRERWHIRQDCRLWRTGGQDA
jgi:hypothetical protein